MHFQVKTTLKTIITTFLNKPDKAFEQRRLFCNIQNLYVITTPLLNFCLMLFWIMFLKIIFI